MTIQNYAVSVSQATELNPTETRAWRGLVHTQARLLRQVDNDLESTHRISVVGFEVLRSLAEADGGRLRMTHLAELVQLSPSGLSRLVDRLAAEQLVERVACPGDGRAINATITAAGRVRLDQARVTLAEAIRLRFLTHFNASEIDLLAGFWLRVSPSCG